MDVREEISACFKVTESENKCLDVLLGEDKNVVITVPADFKTTAVIAYAAVIMFLRKPTSIIVFIDGGEHEIRGFRSQVKQILREVVDKLPIDVDNADSLRAGGSQMSFCSSTYNGDYLRGMGAEVVFVDKLECVDLRVARDVIFPILKLKRSSCFAFTTMTTRLPDKIDKMAEAMQNITLDP